MATKSSSLVDGITKTRSRIYYYITYHLFLEDFPGGVGLKSFLLLSLEVLDSLPDEEDFNLASISAFFRAIIAACSDI